MANRYLHCPFCANSLDTTIGYNDNLADTSAYHISLWCGNCSTKIELIVNEKDYWAKAHRGTCQDIMMSCSMKGNG